jgi:competence protein ComEA
MELVRRGLSTENGGVRKSLLILMAALALLAPLEAARAAGKSAEKIPAAERIDINRATAEELMKAPGLTRPWAERIVRYRPYRSKQELLDKGILSAQVYGRVKERLIAHRGEE